MNAKRSKNAILYDQIRESLQAGRYAPGERIDPAALADEFNASGTPVRFALYRLVGEGVIDDHAREGFHVPLPTDLSLHDLYDWMERLLFTAFEIGFTAAPRQDDPLPAPEGDEDVVTLTRQLFEHIAHATAHMFLHDAVQQANDRLGPIRHAKKGLIDHAHEELARLYKLWHRRDLPALKNALVEYHDRRRRLVPHIVATLTQAARARY